ncbi:hypothetical protein FGG78_38715, partial [Thioclava sp. BHET1]
MDRLRQALDRGVGSQKTVRGFSEAPERFTASENMWHVLPSLQLHPEVMERHRIVALRGGAASLSFDLLRTRLLHQLRDRF